MKASLPCAGLAFVFLSAFEAQGEEISAEEIWAQEIWQAPIEARAERIQSCLDEPSAPAEGDINEGFMPELSRCMDIIARPCLEQPDLFSTQDMKDCTYAETEAWDALLNRYYNDLQTRFKALEAETDDGADYGAQLREAQRNWIAYRDANCQFDALKTFGGSMSGLLFASCKQQMTAQRTVELYHERRFYVEDMESNW